MIKFKYQYFILAIILLVIEILIALFVHDTIIRPYIGDFLVVILIYCCLKSFLNLSPLTTAIAVLLFSYSVEVLQYLNIIVAIGLEHSMLAKIILGTSFEWVDMLAYTLGIIFVLIAESTLNRKKTVIK